MKQQILKMTGLSEDQFYKRYPSEEAFFRDYPHAKQMFQGKSMPKARYGMMVPYAENGLQVQNDPPPDQKDYPDYESWAAAWDEWMAKTQAAANVGQTQPQQLNGMTPGQDVAGASAPSSTATTPTSFKLKDYQGVSIHDFLTTQGKSGDYKSRKNLAKTLGIADYRGTADQNALMMQLIQQNPDVLTDYTGYVAPKGNVTKTVAAKKNSKAAPTTQQLAAAKQQYTGTASNPRESAYYQGTDIVTGQPRFHFVDPSTPSNKVFLNPTTGKYQAIPDPNGMMTAENMYRMQLADKLNATRPVKGQAQFRQGYRNGGNVYPDGYSGTYSAGQYYNDGGSFIPQYGASAYGLPQFELGAPIYADGGMSPEEAMMAEQQMGAPQQGGAPQQKFDQEQLLNAIAQMMQQGMAPEQILQELVSMGVPQIMATELLNLVMQQLQGGMPTGLEQQAAMPPGAGQMPPEQGMMPLAPPPQGMMPPPMGMYGGSYAKGGAIGQEMEVTQQQLEDLRRRGIQFEIV